MYGVGFTGKQINEAANFNGGHSHARAVVDARQADSLERVLTTVRAANLANMEAHAPKTIFHIIDVGAKFSKIGRVLQQATSI